jgi:putative RNA 2'-phosphotransferase
VDIDMETRKYNDISKRISYILRHNATGYTMSDDGYVDCHELARGLDIPVETLYTIVAVDDKNRYVITEDDLIRARYGHSLPVNVPLTNQQPPAILYHGTQRKHEASIRQSGIQPMSRQYVHWSSTTEIAVSVATRRSGELMIIEFNTLLLPDIPYFVTDARIWLTKSIPFGEYFSIRYI